MASSGKKGKKSKGKTVPLTDFLQESATGIVNVPVKKYGSWSEEVDEHLDGGGYESRNKASNVVLPTAPRAARGPDISDDRIPSQGPFIAYISNLPYDVDEEDIAEFFIDMNIESMRLPRDDRGGEGGKLKGFGYVVFEDRSSLVDAISILDTNLKGRRIKIDVATSSDGDRRRGGRMEMGRDRPERPEVAMGDWRSGPRTDPVPEGRGGGGGGGGFRERDREGPPDSNRSGAWRDSADRPSSFRDSDRGERDRGGFTRENMNREPMSREGMNREPVNREPMSREGMHREGMGSDRDRDRFQDRGGRFGDRDRDGDRRGGAGGGYGNRRFGDRDGGGGSGFDRERREERGSDSEFRRAPPRDDAPPADRDQRSRPKLQLAPRTKPIEEQAAAVADNTEETTQAAAAPVPAASIFGAAKPVDTSARERQIEERLAKEKEVRPAPRDSSRDNRPKDDEEDRPPKKEAWARKRSDDEAPRRDSPERGPSSRGPPPRRNDEKRPGPGPRDSKAPSRRDEKPPAKKEERPARDNHEREMPKLKEPEPINFLASNLYSALEPEDDVSD